MQNALPQAVTRLLILVYEKWVTMKKELNILILKTVELARKAIHQFKITSEINYEPLIAASIGPYGAYLANGAEYHGNYGISDEHLKEFHVKRIQLLSHSNAHILAFETIPSFQEAKVISSILQDVAKPAWISFSCKDGQHISDGSHIADGAAVFCTQIPMYLLSVSIAQNRHIFLNLFMN